MGLAAALKEKLKLGRSEEQAEALKDIAKDFDVAEISKEDCGDCAYKDYPSSVNIEGGELLNSAPPTHAQILVATGQHDWKHDISEEPALWGQVCRELGESLDDLKALAGGTVRINGTDMEFDDDDETVTVVVLPQFIKIETTPEKCVADVKAALQTKPGGSPPPGTTVLKDKGFVLLCSHRTRDKRCGVTAPLIRDALCAELRQEQLQSDLNDDDDEGGIKVALCNHVGGHKFAANVLIYKNDGTAVMFARMRPMHAHQLVQKAIIKDTVFPEHTRSCVKLESYEW